MGQTGLAPTATIYGDAIYSTSYPFDRIIGNPQFSDTQYSALLPQSMARSQSSNNWLFKNTLGRPWAWWTQYLGNSQGNQPLLVLKVAPFPDQAYAINIRLAFWPVRLLLPRICTKTLTSPADCATIMCRVR